MTNRGKPKPKIWNYHDLYIYSPLTFSCTIIENLFELPAVKFLESLIKGSFVITNITKAF